MLLTVIVPTRNEAGNVDELLRRIELAMCEDARLDAERTEVLFVDDSTDGTADAVELAAMESEMKIRVLRRPVPTSGLSGAVHEGLRAAQCDQCVVMDGDLQHPPEMIGGLASRMHLGDVDVVVASRYLDGGRDVGLANVLRRGVATTSRALAKVLFPIRLHECSDPMSGFFLVDRRAVNLDELRPRGFKILLEMLARQHLRVAELPLDFAARRAGHSKASFAQGKQFARQLVRLRFG